MERELEFFEKIYFSSQKIYRVRFSNKALILIKMLKNVQVREMETREASRGTRGESIIEIRIKYIPSVMVQILLEIHVLPTWDCEKVAERDISSLKIPQEIEKYISKV